MPYADVLPWDEISLTLDFNDIVENNLNALDVLSKQFDVGRALTMARKVSTHANAALPAASGCKGKPPWCILLSGSHTGAQQLTLHRTDARRYINAGT